MKTLVDEVLSRGLIPVVPTIPWSPEESQRTAAAAMNVQVEQLYSDIPQIVRGPDLWTLFEENPDYLTGDFGVVTEQGRALALPAEPPALQEVRRVVQIFRELRNGQTEDGKTVRVKSPSSTLSTAEAISVINSGMALAGHFGDGVLRAGDVASGLLGAVIKDPVQDSVVWKEDLETVVKERSDWKDLYRACREQL